ncbi:hypothetical protein J6590_046420 [Homalodisca vitripennis]|nr:hypothetical protein J6590_046420 [Homalodisca vitripennis]
MGVLFPSTLSLENKTRSFVTVRCEADRNISTKYFSMSIPQFDGAVLSNQPLISFRLVSDCDTNLRQIAGQGRTTEVPNRSHSRDC